MARRWTCVLFASLAMLWATGVAPRADGQISVLAQAGVAGAVASEAGVGSGEERSRGFANRPRGGRSSRNNSGPPLP